MTCGNTPPFVKGRGFSSVGICDKLYIGFRLAPPERFLAAIAYRFLVPKLKLGKAIAGQSSSFESLKRSFLSHLRSQAGAWERDESWSLGTRWSLGR